MLIHAVYFTKLRHIYFNAIKLKPTDAFILSLKGEGFRDPEIITLQL